MNLRSSPSTVLQCFRLVGRQLLTRRQHALAVAEFFRLGDLLRQEVFIVLGCGGQLVCRRSGARAASFLRGLSASWAKFSSLVPRNGSIFAHPGQLLVLNCRGAFRRPWS